VASEVLVVKQDRTDLRVFSFKVRRIRKMREVVLETSVMITLCACLAALCAAGFSNPIAASDSMPGETRATANETDYASFWAYQWRSLPGHKQNVWMILAPLACSLLRLLITFVLHCCRRRVSCMEEETKQELLQKLENILRELRDVFAFMKGLQERRGWFQKAVDPMKKIVKVEAERHDRFQNEMDSMKKKMKADNESQAQFQNEMVQVKTMMKADDRRRVQLQKRMDSIKSIVKVAHKFPAVRRNKVEPTKRTGATKFS
jgi:hypothetical protein